MNSKTVAESKTQMSQLMMPQHANMNGTVYGGTILSIADSVAYVCAAKHAGPYCVTAAVDRVNFRHPIYIGEVVTFLASVNYVGRSSMEVGIKIFAENLKTGEKRHTNSCYFTMVCLDDAGKPKEVPKLVPETDVEKRHWAEAEIRRKSARETYKNLDY